MPIIASSETSNPKKRLSLGLLIGIGVSVFLLVAFLFYLSRPVTSHSAPTASVEAKAYVSKLNLSDVTMQATENFMKQKVVEIEGKLGNGGDRTLRSVEVFCLFYGIDGREIHRERVPVFNGKDLPLRPNETRVFRLPFDNLPEGWNQVMPRMVIANISFAE